MRREPTQEAIVALRAEAVRDNEPEEAGEERAYLNDTLAQSLNLAHRSLRRADLRHAKFYAVDLRQADLRGALLRDAVLTQAQLSGADLRGADLTFAHLKYANDCANDHEQKELCQLRLELANLSGAELQGARLRGANLRGANLQNAKLQGADLSLAQLQGANLAGAQLRGAVLCGAQLQGANLDNTNLASADMSSTWGGCQTGTPTSLYRARFSDGTDLRYADLRGVTDAPPADPDRAALRALMADVDQNSALTAEQKALLNTLAGESFPAWNPAPLPGKQVAYAIVDGVAPESIKHILSQQVHNQRPDSLKSYENAVAGDLKALICDQLDTATTRGLIRRLWIATTQEPPATLPTRVARAVQESGCECKLKGLAAYERAFIPDIARQALPD